MKAHALLKRKKKEGEKMGKIYSLLRREEKPPERQAGAEVANAMRDPQETAGAIPALPMPAAASLNYGTATVSPAQFAKLAGVGHNLVRSWCHLPGFPVHREGWRFHINVEMGIQWLNARAAAREGMDDQSSARIR